MADFDWDVGLGPPKKKLSHEIGRNVDDLSAPELADRIALMREEIVRLERAIAEREKTKLAAHSVFKL
jgi:uncharacterized small protein (DUF1192 family)